MVEQNASYHRLAYSQWKPVQTRVVAFKSMRVKKLTDLSQYLIAGIYSLFLKAMMLNS